MHCNKENKNLQSLKQDTITEVIFLRVGFFFILQKLAYHKNIFIHSENLVLRTFLNIVMTKMDLF